jgi:hypothetical protein
MRSTTRLELLLGAAFALLIAAPGSAQNAAPPDFSSNQTAWNGIGGGEWVPVPGSPRPVTQDPRYKYVPNGTGAQPTFRIGDVTNPNLKQWAKDVMKKDNDEVLAGKVAFTARSSCRLAGVPGFMVMGGGQLYFVQSPKEVLILFDGDAHVRRIHMNAQHTANPKPSWYGDSVGKYEGDTLVVDTIGLNAKTFVDAYRTPHTEKIHVVERWRLIEGGDKLEVHVTPTRSISRGRRSGATRGARGSSPRTSVRRTTTSSSATTMISRNRTKRTSEQGVGYDPYTDVCRGRGGGIDHGGRLCLRSGRIDAQSPRRS